MFRALFVKRHNEQVLRFTREVGGLVISRPNMATHEGDSEAGAGMMLSE